MSADIISMDAHREEELARAWARYVDLDRIACETKCLEDGIAAGRARHEFYDLFDRPDQRRMNVAFRNFGRTAE